jgi:uncharacterized transporter YbjL
MKAVLTSRSAFVTLLIALAMLVNAGLDHLAGDRKLRAAGLADATVPVSIVVGLAVTPEQFHMNRVQAAGTMVGAEGRSIRLRNVSPQALRDLANRSWVAQLRRIDS